MLINVNRNIFTIAEKNSENYQTIAFLRWSLVIIFIWFGAMKFTYYEAIGISSFIENSPLVSWLHTIFGIQGASYFLGTMELLTAFFLIIGAFNSISSAIGGLMATMTFCITLTFMFTTPGVSELSAGGFPAISALPGQFLLKDLVLLAASICILKTSIKV